MNLKLLVVAMLSVLGLAGCGGDDHDDNDGGDSPAKILKAVEFTETPAPSTLDEMAKTYSKSTVKLSYTNGSVVEKPLSYTTLFSVKDKISEVKGQRHPAGQLYNYKMEALLDPMGNPVVAETPDANSLLNIGDKLFLVTHYEYDWLLSDGSVAFSTPVGIPARRCR
ncbi:MAG: hypothetical protein IPK63_17695 [Candidatus Competibacteraceae bacterium]|nr:hypothetical protein [Candidatus Competibacteraceae bacterium]